MGSGEAMSPQEGESYHLALARVSVAASIEEARKIATTALREWRAGAPKAPVCRYCGLPSEAHPRYLFKGIPMIMCPTMERKHENGDGV